MSARLGQPIRYGDSVFSRRYTDLGNLQLDKAPTGAPLIFKLHYLISTLWIHQYEGLPTHDQYRFRIP